MAVATSKSSGYLASWRKLEALTICILIGTTISLKPEFWKLSLEPFLSFTLSFSWSWFASLKKSVSQHFKIHVLFDKHRNLTPSLILLKISIKKNCNKNQGNENLRMRFFFFLFYFSYMRSVWKWSLLVCHSVFPVFASGKAQHRVTFTSSLFNCFVFIITKGREPALQIESILLWFWKCRFR